MKSILLLLCLSGYCCAGPLGFKKNMPILQRDDEPMIMEPASAETEAEQPAPAAPEPEMVMMSTLTLPSNATSIRADITDNFSCDNKTYGYYADVDNECQIFHVCLPVTYADGKENTFRWSFICPEETVFSQESFTCMRREDMTIDCEDSYQYYELNRNFGMIEEESNKNTNSNSNSNSNTMPVANEDQEIAMSVQTAQQEQQPIEEEKIEMQAPIPVPAQVQPQPIKQQEKPVKVQKPNRRKPVHTHSTQKKPATYPVRKMPQATPAALEATPIQHVEIVQAEEVVKPVVQRYTKRPVTMSTAIKERIQPGKAETTPIRVELYNQNRRRPVYFNKKDTPIAKPADEEKVEVAQPELSEPVPTLKIESIFNTAANTQDASQAVDDKVQSELPKSDSPATETDAETQASETAVVILKPVASALLPVEESPKVEDEQTLLVVPMEKISEPLPSEPEVISIPSLEEAPKADETQAPIEAIEEIPAVIIEMVENEQASNDEKNVAEETIIKADEGYVAPTKEDTHLVANESVVNAEEAVKTVEEAVNTAEEISAAESHIVLPEENKLLAAEQPIVFVDAPIAEPEVSMASPEIFEENSEEGLAVSQNLAELEAQKPADAVETMPATLEMEQQVPVVQQMFEDTDAHKQSMGGFKPVDPIMAAEAEALITDFINTLRKSEIENAKPVQPIEMPEDTQVNAAEHDAVKLNSEENEKTESQEAVEIINNAAETAEKSDVPVLTEVEISPLEEQEKETDIPADPEMLKNAAPISNIMHNFPAEMYQIPVQVIETPIEEVQNEEKQVEKTETPVEQPQVPEESHISADYASLSIDDIVELVKERLDQVPTAEKGAPIELVMEHTSNEKPVEKTEELKSAEEKPVEQQSEEEIVMPIYHRVSELDTNMLKAQNTVVDDVNGSSDDTAEDKPEGSVSSMTAETEEKLTQTDDAGQADSNTETDAQVPSATDDAKTKASRFYRSRSMKNAKMDPRKRRFLFRSDAS